MVLEGPAKDFEPDVFEKEKDAKPFSLSEEIPNMNSESRVHR